MTIYNKLVRDRIPEIIRLKGGDPVTHAATPEEYEEKLRAKLNEEVQEFLESGSPEELADILEVVYALGEMRQIDREQLESIRKQKAEERGTFTDRVILERS